MVCISIGMPVYDGEKYVEQAIESVLAQTFKDFELVISDNGSTDKTQKICEAYIKKDKRIKYYRADWNHGAAWNFNKVLELSNGEYFKWFSSDDILHPDFLKAAVKKLNDDKNIILCYSRVKLIDEKSRENGRYDVDMRLNSDKVYERFSDIILAEHGCFSVFGLMRSNKLKRAKHLGNYYAADKNLLAELSLMGKFHKFPEFLMFRRDHPETSSRLALLKGKDYYKYYSIWFDPSNKGKKLLPIWNLLLNYFNSVIKSNLSYADKFFCYIQIGRFALNINHLKSLIKEPFEFMSRQK